MAQKIALVDFDLPLLYRSSGNPVGGTAVEWSNWIMGLNSQGVDVDLIAGSGAAKIMLNYSGGVFEAYDENKGLPYLKNAFYRLPRLMCALRKTEAKIVFQQNAGLLTGLTALACLLTGKKFVYRVGSDIDATEEARKKLGLVKYIIFRLALNSAHLIVCQNDFQLSKLKKTQRASRVTKIYNPIHIDQKGLSSVKKENVVTWVGNFRPVKGIHKLIPLARAFPEVQFKVAGGELVTKYDGVEEAISCLKSLKNVEFLGHISRQGVHELLSSSRVLINTSEYEGLSNTFLEAMLSGTRILTSTRANPDNIISTLNLGFVVKSDDHYIDGLRFLMSQTDDEEFLKQSRLVVLQRFNAQIQAKKLISFLELGSSK